MVLFFSYISEDQEINDEERQVQIVHVNSNAEEGLGSQYETYSQTSEIATSSSKQLDQSLTFKK